MEREITLIYGQTGSGKTTKARELLLQTQRALVIEAGFNEFPAQQFADLESLFIYLERLNAYSNYDAAPPRISQVPFRVAYTPRLYEHPVLFDLARELGNVTMLLEEADRFDDPRQFPEYDEIITRGRHYEISVIAVGLHFYKLPKELRRQATHVISFKQIDAGDIDALAEVVGMEIYKFAPDESGKTSQPDFSYLDWTPRTGSVIISPRQSTPTI